MKTSSMTSNGLKRGQAETAIRPKESRPGDETRIRFWGVRGSIPAPGPDTIFYGGNTSCVEIRVDGQIVVLDAGTGIRKLGLALKNEFQQTPINLSLLISHTHWDHIQGFPFFLPAYDSKNKVTIYGFEGASKGLQNTLSSQMESPYFPVSLSEMPGHIAIRELKEPNFTIGDIQITAKTVKHPGTCIGYRLSTPSGSISYVPDVELFGRLREQWLVDTDMIGREKRRATPPEDKELIDFIRDSDILILDSQYDASEYPQRVGWGHSCVEDSVAFALHAGVRNLFLFHHDPDHTDAHISRMLARARELAGLRHSRLVIEAAREGAEIVLKPPRARNALASTPSGQ